MSAAARVTAVVPSWNGRALLDMVLPTLLAQTLQPLRVLVVDNGSSDGSVEHVRSAYPGIEVLALAENEGFAAAVNAGAAAAATELVALFNNDMELDAGCVEELVRTLDEHPEAGSATAKMLMLREPGVLDGAGDALTWWGGAWRRGHGESDGGRWDEPAAVLSACGGAALYRRAALEAVGPFDASFFAYLEDLDWGVRAQLRGYACRYVPTAVVRHLGGATTRQMGDLETYLIHRNAIALVLKNFPAARLAAAAPALVAFQVWQLARAAREGRSRAVLRAWRDALRRLPGTVRSRRGIQAARSVPARRLAAVIGWRRP